MIEKHECRQVGVLVKAHGVNGELVLRLFEEFSIDHVDVEFLFIDMDGGLVPYYLEEAREKKQADVLIKLALVDNDKSTEQLIDMPVYVKMKDTSNDEEEVEEPFSAYQLVGYQTEAVGLGQLGEIVAIKDIAKNPLFEIDYQGRELLIPIVEDFIVKIDDEKQIIVFKLPEGLVDLD
ncbi:ribosome maturation factor RimM [Carboxylicivirga sp. N1Y90]|uniref:ribosome maturation factor RimM n=1 Tax=Carboxylicivirga fragile TaxID=3417571 RepID=UPI003D336241|nr:16S rRNA processing protein RimM [Marinilabiliaceae bacterium N1Y90]